MKAHLGRLPLDGMAVGNLGSRGVEPFDHHERLVLEAVLAVGLLAVAAARAAWLGPMPSVA